MTVLEHEDVEQPTESTNTGLSAELIRIREESGNQLVESELSLPLQIEMDAYYEFCDRDYDQISRPINKVARTKSAIQESMSRNHELLPSLDLEKKKEPTMTICMPVALSVEDPVQIAEALSRINNSAVDGEFEVIVWANTKSGDLSEEDIQTKYAALTDELAKLDCPKLEIRPALQVLDETQATITNIRGNYMEAVALDCQQRGYGPDHPVMWLDADTTFVSGGSLEAIADSVRTEKGIFVHANLQFSADWATGVPLDQLDSATKAFVANEIHRRQGQRNRAEFNDPAGYLEESGLAFSLGTYLLSGGVNRTYDINESAHLTLKYDQNYLGPIRQAGNEERYRELDSKFYHYIKAARIGSSGRRHYELAKKEGVDGLFDPDVTGYGYGGLYSEMQPSSDANDKEYDMKALLERKEATESPRTELRQRYSSQNARMLERLFRSQSTEKADSGEKD